MKRARHVGSCTWHAAGSPGVGDNPRFLCEGRGSDRAAAAPPLVSRVHRRGIVAVALSLPRLSDEMKEGTISRWLKGVGDTVAKGEPVVEVETEKVIVEVEANTDGVIVEIIAPEQAVVPVGGLLCRIGGKEEAPAVASTSAPKRSPAAAPVPPLPPQPQPSARPEPPAGEETARASPLARRIANELGIDLGTVLGTGPGGRIVAADLHPLLSGAGTVPATGSAPSSNAREAAGVTGGFQDVPLSALRRTIARRMAESKQAIPHFYMATEVDVTDLLRERERLNRALPDEKVTVNDLMLKAVALALEQVPELNAAWLGDGVRRFSAVHIGFAVAIDEGLVTPVVRDCHVKSLGRIAREARELTRRAKSRTLTAEDLQGGTFTISNLGMFEVSAFAAIINPPQVGILAIAQPRQEPAVYKGRQAVRSRLTATLSADHRAVDGVTGARFLKVFKDILELPEKVLTS